MQISETQRRIARVDELAVASVETNSSQYYACLYSCSTSASATWKSPAQAGAQLHAKTTHYKSCRKQATVPATARHTTFFEEYCSPLSTDLVISRANTYRTEALSNAARLFAFSPLIRFSFFSCFSRLLIFQSIEPRATDIRHDSIWKSIIFRLSTQPFPRALSMPRRWMFPLS